MHGTRALIFGNIGLWTVLWVAGAPLPNEADLFFIGPALELVKNGTLTNPLIRFWSPEATEVFFFQPPVFPYVAAGWMTIFGVSAASLTALQCVTGAVATTTGGQLIHRLGWRGAWCLSMAIAMMALTQGLRHDMLGVALLCGGLLLLSSQRPSIAGAGVAVILGATVTWPVLACYALPFGAGVLARRPRTSVEWKRLAIGAGTASLVVGLLFLVLIDFAFVEFIRQFSWHARLRRQEFWEAARLVLVHGWYPVSHGPLYPLAAALLVATLVRWEMNRPLAALAVALIAAVVLNAVLYIGSWQLIATHILSAVVMLLALNLPLTRFRTAAVAAALIAFAMSHWPSLIGWSFVPGPKGDDHRRVAQQVPTDRCVGVDEFAARYIFDYRLPVCAFSWNYSLSAPSGPPTVIEQKLPGTTWVVSRSQNILSAGLPAPAPVVVLGYPFRTISRDRFVIDVIQ